MIQYKFYLLYMNIYPITLIDIQYIFDIYIYIYIYIHIFSLYYLYISIKLMQKFVKQSLRFLFFATLLQHIHTLVTLVSHPHNLCQLLLPNHCH